MTTPANDLAAEVLDLPAEERARILELCQLRDEVKCEKGLAEPCPSPARGGAKWQSSDGSR